MTMETTLAEAGVNQDERRKADRFYGETRGGAGLYAEVSPRQEPRAIATDDIEHEG